MTCPRSADVAAGHSAKKTGIPGRIPAAEMLCTHGNGPKGDRDDMQSDAELVTKACDGRRDAFATLVQRYERAVCAATRSVLHDHHAAEDAAQQAFLTAFVKLDSLRDKSAFGGWVMKIARREAVRLAYRRRRAQLRQRARIAEAGAGNGKLNDAARRLLEAVMDLPAHERLALMLKHFEGHSAKEIAVITGRPVGTVTKQLSRGRQRLRERLERWNHDS